MALHEVTLNRVLGNVETSLQDLVTERKSDFKAWDGMVIFLSSQYDTCLDSILQRMEGTRLDYLDSSDKLKIFTRKKEYLEFTRKEYKRKVSKNKDED